MVTKETLIAFGVKNPPDVLPADKTTELKYTLAVYLTVGPYTVVNYLYGIEGGKPMSVKDVAEKLRVTEESIEEVRAKALLKMRQPPLSTRINEVCGQRRTQN